MNLEQYHEATLGKKGTGGLRRRSQGKKLAQYGGVFTATKVTEKEEERYNRRGTGGTRKVTAKYVKFANVLTEKGVKKAAIRTVAESPANRHFARQNIMTKGNIIDTELGKARITNRVGQDGVVNCILIQK
ncbi:30S ribosomal protein S8e [Candidatus Gugararchaeum adminiculabundum]|nr:30S ribosomal protein S8e [Candidatus Gugararchaeum adminiculabundum]